MTWNGLELPDSIDYAYWLEFAHRICIWRITDSFHNKGNNLCSYPLVYRPRCVFSKCRAINLKSYKSFLDVAKV